ncbi:EMILIN-2 [Brachyhypopomus gauderio]|uniref:EMILIN-2 n=1 Tax=Brachyhypopomus gauderio TaxID=698409 RepID=UPI00404310D1
MTHKQRVFSVRLVLMFLLSFSLSHGSPSSLFLGTAYSGPVHRHRNKNWCAFIVQKNVSCAVQGKVESRVEPEASPCPIHQPDCQQHLIYRTQYRPTYSISYKTVTALEWRCCPGYHGPDCRDLKGSTNTQTIVQHQPQPGHTRTTQKPERRESRQHDGHPGAEKTRQLEQEIQRLSQTVLDLQETVSRINTNLQTHLQQDTSKMLVTLLNNMRPPDSARTGDTQGSVAHLDGHQATRGRIHSERGLEEVLVRLNDVTDELKSKDEAIEELRDAVTGHDGQIRMLMDTSQVPADTVGSSSDLDVLQTYIDGKFDKLKKELTVAMKDEIAKVKSECADRILSLQEMSEDGQMKSYVSMTELLESKETDLRKEIRKLHLDLAMSDGLVSTSKQSPITEDNTHNLWQELQRVAEANRILNARVDNELQHLSMLQLEDVFGPRLDELEVQMNVTERNSEAYCFYVDEKITKELSDEMAKIRLLLDDRLNSLEDQFTAMLLEMTNNSFPGLFSDSVDTVQNQVNTNKNLIQRLEDKINGISQICSTGCQTGPSIEPPNSRGLESIAKDVKRCMNKLDVLNSDVESYSMKLVNLGDKINNLSLENQQNGESTRDLYNKLKPLMDDVSSVTGAMAGMRDSVSRFSRDLQSLNSSCCLAGQGEWVQRPSPGTYLPHEDRKPSLGQLKELHDRFNKLSGQVTTELSLCKEKAADMAEGFSAVDGRVAALEKACGKENEQTIQVQGMKEGVERHLAQVNSSLLTHSREINALQTNLLNIQMQLAALKGYTTKLQGVPRTQERASAVPDSRTQLRRKYVPEIHIPLIIPHRMVPVTASPRHTHAPMQPGRPRQQPPAPRRPAVETGEAGPPGYARRVTVRRDHTLEESGQPVKGFAGAPGLPPISPVAYRPGTGVSEVLWNPAHKLVATPVASERNWFADPFSFSAGLTQQMFLGDFGIIRFNKVLVNDGGHYNPQTGIFTAPADGRYLVTGLLTARHRERVEAVLSVSERSVLKLDSAGHSGASEPVSRPLPCWCGGSASFSVVLSLRAGDRVALVRTAGALAVSEAKEVLSTFSAVFLYPPQVRR